MVVVVHVYYQLKWLVQIYKLYENSEDMKYKHERKENLNTKHREKNCKTKRVMQYKTVSKFKIKILQISNHYSVVIVSNLDSKSMILI